MHLAEIAKIAIVPHSLIRIKSGNLAYITKRIDWVKKSKLHMEDMCQLTERLTEDKYRGFFYAWRKIEGLDQEIDPKTGLSTKVHGIDSMYTLIRGMLDQHRLCDIIHNFIYLPDSSKKEEKILCRYPQYYAATKLLQQTQKLEKRFMNLVKRENFF